jgi:hypothetical protein
MLSRSAGSTASVSNVDGCLKRCAVLVGIASEGWTPTQQFLEFSPSLRLLPRGCYFYLRKEGKC